jgi:uncharacterized protein (TIGR02284 family)
VTTEETITELNGLIQTCKDGELGYTAAATHVHNTELETIFTECAAQRRRFARALHAEVERLGGHAQESGSAGGTLLRGWLELKSAVTDGSGAAIIATCETGEEVAVAAFNWAVNLGFSGSTRSLVERQGKAIKEAQARLLRLKAEYSGGANFQKNDRTR